jgi:hypothetical protein
MIDNLPISSSDLKTSATEDLAALLDKAPFADAPSSTRVTWLLKLSAALDAADLGDLAESAREGAAARISQMIEFVS